jgi:hypothetical protein
MGRGEVLCIPEGERTIRRPKLGWKFNTKICAEEIGWADHTY